MFGAWLVLAAGPAAAQLSPLTSQSFFYQQAGGAQSGNYLAANAGVIYTTNVERTSSGSDDTLLMIGLSGADSHEGARLDYHLTSDLALLKYFSSAFPTRPTGYLDALGALKLVPGFFSWIARETFSQVQINPYEPITPDNLVSLNYITTGPRFTLRPTLRTSVRLDLLYSYLSTSSTSTQYTSFDNHRYGGDLRIDRAFSEAASVYLTGHYEKAEFKNTIDNHNYAVAEGLLGYKLHDGRTVFDVSGGYSQIHIYDVATMAEGIGGSRESLETQTFSDPVWTVDISRLITPSQRVALIASQRFTDAASVFRLGFDQAVPVMAPPQIATSDVFKQTLVGANWHLQASRTTLDIGVSAYKQRFLLATAAAQNSNYRGVNALLARQISPALRWGIGAQYQHQEEVGTQPGAAAGPVANTWGALTDLHWQVGERLALRFIYAHTAQSGVYADNQIGVTASWSLIAPQATTAQPYPALSPIAPASTRAP
ncbi:MAG: hypothetical protein JO184_00525 [Gammaproteobacteria bacterium]|nr:hypothetical protein [Gammaproteobacteria bacterium]